MKKGMIKMLQIHEFWTSLFPIFKDSYEFVYVFFDIATIIFLIDLFLTVPKILIGRSTKI